MKCIMCHALRVSNEANLRLLSLVWSLMTSFDISVYTEEKKVFGHP